MTGDEGETRANCWEETYSQDDDGDEKNLHCRVSPRHKDLDGAKNASLGLVMRIM